MQWQPGDVVMALVGTRQGVRAVIQYTASIRKKDGMLVWYRKRDEAGGALVSFPGYRGAIPAEAKQWVERYGGIWAGEGGIHGELCINTKVKLTFKQEMRRALDKVNKEPLLDLLNHQQDGVE